MKDFFQLRVSLDEAKLDPTIERGLKVNIKSANKSAPKIIKRAEQLLKQGITYDDFWEDEDIADDIQSTASLMHDLDRYSLANTLASSHVMRSRRPKDRESAQKIHDRFDQKEVKMARKYSDMLEKLIKKIDKQIGTRWH